MISSIVQLVMRVGFALILSKYIGQGAVYWGEISAWIGADILLYFVYRTYIKNTVLKNSSL